MGLVIRQTFKASVANYIGVAFGFINILILMPLIFSKSEIGILRMLIDNHVALAGFALMGITSSLNRYFPKFKNDPTGKNHGMDFWAAVIPFIGFVLISLLLVAAKDWLVWYFQDNAAEFLEYYLLFIPLVFSQVFFSVFEAAAAIEGRIVVPKLLKEVVLRVTTAIAFLCYYFGWLNFTQSIFLLLFFYVIQVVFVLYYFKSLRKINLRPDFKFIKENPEIIKDFFGYTSLITLGSISGLVIAKLDFTMISSMMGLGHTGVYALAFHAAMIIEIPKRALTQILAPTISEHLNNGLIIETEDLNKRTAIIQYIPGLFLLLGLLINIENLYEIMPNGKDFIDGKYVIAIIASAKCFEMISGSGYQILLYSKFYYVSFIMTVTSAIFGIYLNLWLIPLFGINGAALATALVLIFQQLLINGSIFLNLKIHPLSWPILWLTLIFLFVLFLNYLLPVLPNVWLDIAVRSSIFPGLFVLIVYKLKLSEDANKLIRDVINRIKNLDFKIS
jgi:O-antigen/teichoic acid export membrane protein